MLVTRLASPNRAMARARPTAWMKGQATLLAGEDTPDDRLGPAPGGVPAMRRHGLAARLRPLELRHQPAPRQQCDVCRRDRERDYSLNAVQMP